MESFIEWITLHAPHAHWFIFGAILLAGINIPISADLLIIGAAFLAATVVPENTIHLYLSILFGCYFSAWIAYWTGRLLGSRFLKYNWFRRFLPPERLEKAQKFYEKHGLWTLLLGRFIPFGVRNCIFISSGMSRLSFLKFALWDLIACSIWVTLSFYIFYTLGQNYQLLYENLKIFNLCLFGAFGVTLIGVIWYKRRKKAPTHAEPVE
jgi:membrane protein DedA with SNARE-associated domain